MTTVSGGFTHTSPQAIISIVCPIVITSTITTFSVDIPHEADATLVQNQFKFPKFDCLCCTGPITYKFNSDNVLPTSASTPFTANGFQSPVTSDANGDTYFVKPSDTSTVSSSTAYIHASFSGIEMYSPQVTMNIVCGTSATVTESTYPGSLTDTQEVDFSD